MNNEKQQKLREWIMKQEYLFLNSKYDGMTAWEIAGIILREIEEEETVEELTLSEMTGMTVKIKK